MCRILIVLGSLRANSFNRRLASEIAAKLKGKAEVHFLDYADLPWLSQDEEFPPPQAVARVRDQVAGARGIWFVCPEYNGSYPGHVKNLIDWLSRPTTAGDYDTVTIRGKATTVSGCAGKSGSRMMQAKLHDLLGAVGCRVMSEPTCAFVIPPTSWATDEISFDDDQRAAIQAQATAFLEFVESAGAQA